MLKMLKIDNVSIPLLIVTALCLGPPHEVRVVSPRRGPLGVAAAEWRTSRRAQSMPRSPHAHAFQGKSRELTALEAHVEVTGVLGDMTLGRNPLGTCP